MKSGLPTRSMTILEKVRFSISVASSPSSLWRMPVSLPGSRMSMPTAESVMARLEKAQSRMTPSPIQPTRTPPEWLTMEQFVTVTRSQGVFFPSGSE